MVIVEYTPKFKKLFYKLPINIQEIARKVLDRLEQQPFGDRLTGSLRDSYSIHFYGNRYRIVWTKVNDKIIVYYIGKRTDHFYEDVSKYL